MPICNCGMVRGECPLDDWGAAHCVVGIGAGRSRQQLRGECSHGLPIGDCQECGFECRHGRHFELCQECSRDPELPPARHSGIMAQCPHCSWMTPKDGRYCMHCGKPVGDHNLLGPVAVPDPQASDVDRDPPWESSSGRSPFSAAARGEFLNQYDLAHSYYDDRSIEQPPPGVDKITWTDEQRDRAVADWERAWEALKDAEETHVPTRRGRAELDELRQVEARLRADKDAWQHRSDSEHRKYDLAARMRSGW